MGILIASDWLGHWIASPSIAGPLFRKTFQLNREIAHAFLYVTGLGFYELHINGLRPQTHVLDSAFTRYDKRVLYSTYDVTLSLQFTLPPEFPLNPPIVTGVDGTAVDVDALRQWNSLRRLADVAGEILRIADCPYCQRRCWQHVSTPHRTTVKETIHDD